MRTRCYGLLALIVIAIVVRASVVVPAQTSDTNRNRDVVRRHLDLMNRGDWRQAAELFAPDVQHRSGNWQTGTEAVFRGRTLLAGNLEDIFRPFPDWKMDHVMADPMRLAAMPAAPPPRRFSQAVAATFAMAIAMTLFAGASHAAWLIEGVFGAGSMSVAVRRFCLPAYVYHLLWSRTPATPCPSPSGRV